LPTPSWSGAYQPAREGNNIFYAEIGAAKDKGKSNRSAKAAV
jgi:hypothetical protein